jgi:hypothetical protein
MKIHILVGKGLWTIFSRKFDAQIDVIRIVGCIDNEE